ncbi:MAG: hypothetical protein ACXVX7_00020 [Mycobacterium sp.]
MTRTLQSLPVADAICSPGRQVIFPERVDDGPYWGSDLNDAVLSQCTRVNFGVAPPQQDIMPVRNEMLDGAQIAQRLADHIGPQRLPFDRMWFEGVWPGSVGDAVSGAQEVAVYASTQMKDKDTGEIQKGIGMTPYFLVGDGSIARFPVAVRMEADKDGIPQKVRFARYSNTDSSPEQDRVGLAMVLPAMWAIGLMNCRNVETTEVTRVAVKNQEDAPRPQLRGAELSHHRVAPTPRRGRRGWHPHRQGPPAYGAWAFRHLHPRRPTVRQVHRNLREALAFGG